MRSAPAFGVFAALISCAGDGDDSLGPCVPAITRPASLTIAEGESSTFEIALADVDGCSASGRFYFGAADFSDTQQLSAEPPVFALSRTNPSMTVTVTALIDADSMDQAFNMELYITGTIARESLRIPVTVVEPFVREP